MVSGFVSSSAGSINVVQIVDIKSDKNDYPSFPTSQYQQIQAKLKALPAVQETMKQARRENSPIRISKDAIGSSHSITVMPDGRLYLHLKEQLGKGAAKTVTKVIDLSNGRIFAKKSCTFLDDEEKALLIREYQMASCLPKDTTSMPVPSTLRVKKNGKKGAKLIYFEELMHHGDLKKSNHLITSTNLLSFAKQMASLVAGFHKTKILHRDIKPENFFIKSVSDDDIPDLRLGDLGEAVKFSDASRKESYAGSESTWSPEYCKGFLSKNPEELSSGTTIKSDSWQLGMSMLIAFRGHLDSMIGSSVNRMLIYELAGYSSSLNKLDKIQAISKLTEDKWLQKPQKGTVEFVIYNLLRINPQERWSAQQAADYLEAMQKKAFDQPGAAPAFFQLLLTINTMFMKLISSFSCGIHRVVTP